MLLTTYLSPMLLSFGQRTTGRRDPTILLQAEIITLGATHESGMIVTDASLPWFEILKEIKKNPNLLFPGNLKNS